MEEAELWKGYRNTAEKGKLREPAQAVAVAKCLLARLDYRVGDSHPEPCKMCKVEGGRLMTIYEEWMQWSGLNDPDNRHKTLIMFEELPRETQHQEVRKAQGYVRQVHRSADSADSTGPDPEEGVAEDGRSGGSEERSSDHQGTARPRATGRTSGGVRREKRDGGATAPEDPATHSGNW